MKQWGEDRKQQKNSSQPPAIQKCLQWMDQCIKNFGNSVAEFDVFNDELTVGGTASTCKHCKQKSGNAVNRMDGFKNYHGPMDDTNLSFDHYVAVSDKEMIKYTRDMINSLNCCS